MKHFLRMLGVDDEASWQQIRDGYRDQIKVWHPDRFVGDAGLQNKAEERTKEIHYALRRLEELKKDIGESFDPSLPFIKQYADATNGGNGEHGKATFEDRRMGYINESFGNWKAVTNSLSDSMIRSAKAVKQAVQPIRRRRPTTVKIAKQPTTTGPYFLIVIGCIVVLSTIGAYNLMQLIPDSTYEPEESLTPTATQTAERELLQTLLSEPGPKYEKNLADAERIKLAQERQVEPRSPLLAAAMQCDEKKALTLIRQGAEIDELDSLGHSALMWTAKRNCAMIAKALLERGANTELRSTNGFTAYRWAEWYRNTDTLKVFAAHKVKR